MRAEIVVSCSGSASGIGPESTTNVQTIRSSHEHVTHRHRLRPAGFEPATKGFKGPRVSTRLGLSHPPRRSRRAVRSTRAVAQDPAAAREEAGRSSAGIIVGTHPASL